MRFYDALQLDPIVLKENIKNAATKKDKNWFLKALIIRSILCVAFALVFIGGLSPIFGVSNNPPLVMIFCMILCLRFIDFDYDVKDSLWALAAIFMILTFGPILDQSDYLIFNFFVNFFSLLTLMILTSEKPEMGNAGLYAFGFVFLTGSPVSGHDFNMRLLLMFGGFILCSLLFYKKHGKKVYSKRLLDVFRNFSLKTSKGQWQFKIALGVSLAFLIGQFFQIPRLMWIAFATSSILSPYGSNIRKRTKERIVGILIGCFLFYILYLVTPESLTSLFGILSGICLGFCGTYGWKTVFNCFGALLLASSVFGLHGAISIRILNNLFGVLFAITFLYLYSKITSWKYFDLTHNKPSNYI